MRLVDRLRRHLYGHDVFISYARADAVDYARALANALREWKLDAYIDQLGTPPGPHIPLQLLLRLRRSSMLTLIASPAAAVSRAVEQEVSTFVASNQNLFVVDVAGALDEVKWYRDRIKGGAARLITPAELASGVPSSTIIDHILKSVDFARREERLKKVFRNVGVGIVCFLLVGGIGAAILAGQAVRAQRQAVEQTRLADVAKGRAAAADREKRTAEMDTKAARDSASLARANAVISIRERDLAREEARVASDTLLARRRTGQALDLANRASAAMDSTGDGLARGALLSLESLAVEWTVEGMSAWMHAMMLIPPRLHLREAHVGEVTAVAASSDGRQLASGAGDGRVRIWEVRSEPDPLRWMRVTTVLAAELAFGDTVFTLAFSQDGRRLAAGSRNRRLRVWDLETGEARDLRAVGPEGEWRVRGGAYVHAAEFSPNGRWLAAAVRDSTAWLFDTRTWARTRVGGDRRDVAAVAFSRDSRWLMIGGTELDTWDVENARRAAREDRPGWAGDVTALTFRRDGSILAAATQAGIELRRVGTGEGGTLTLTPPREVEALPVGPHRSMAVAFSRDGTYLAHSQRNDRTARVRDERHGRDEDSRMVEVSGGVAFGGGDAFGTGWMATGHTDGTLAFWTANGAKEVMRIALPRRAYPTATAFSPDGRWLAMAGEDSVMRIFDARTYRPVRSLRTERIAVAVAFSPDARWLVAARNDGLEVLDMETGAWRPASPSRRSEGDLIALAFSPDGRFVATWFARTCRETRQELRVWDLASGAELAGDWPGCKPWLSDPAWHAGSAPLLRAANGWPRIERSRLIEKEWTSPDGMWRVTTNYDRTVLTEAASGREIARFRGSIRGVAFSPDGAWLATADVVSLRLWLVGDRERMIAELCARLPVRLRGRPTTTAPSPRNLCTERAARHSGASGR